MRRRPKRKPAPGRAARIAEQQRSRPRSGWARSRRSNEILGSIFRGPGLRQVKTENGHWRRSWRERLDRATAAIEGEATGDPLGVARMQIVLGELAAQPGLPGSGDGLFIKARATFAAGLGPDHPETLEIMNNLARSYAMAGQIDRALQLFGETLELRKAKLGPDHPDTLMSMNNLAASYIQAGQIDRAFRLFRETLELRKAKLGPDHPDTLMSMNNLAVSYIQAGQIDLRPQALGGDAGIEQDEARPRPPRHDQEHGSPRHEPRMADQQIDRALQAPGGGTGAEEGEARPRPPRHVGEHE